MFLMGKANKKRKKLAAQLSLRTGIVLVILLLILISSTLYLSYKRTVKNAEENLRLSADINSGITELYLSKINEQLRALSRAIAGLEGLPPPQSHHKEESLLKEYLAAGGFYSVNTYWEPDTFFKSTPNGRFVSAEGSEIVTYPDYDNYSKGPLYISAKEGSLTYISEPYTINTADKQGLWVIEAGRPILRANGDFLGAVSFVIRLDSLLSLAEVKSPYKSAYSYLISSKGTYLSFPKDGGKTGYPLDDASRERILTLAASGQGELFEAVNSYGGENAYKIVVPVKPEGVGTSWASVFIVNRAEPLEELFHNLTVLTIAAIIGVIILLFIVSGIIRRSLKPVKPIMQLAGCMDRGELNADIEVKADNELGELAAIFNRTTHRLSSYVGEISSILGSMAEGDLTRHTTQDYTGDFKPVKAALEELSAGLNSMLRNIDSAAAQVDISAREVSNGAGLMSTVSTQQAAVMLQLTTAISTVSEDAVKNSQHARTASDKMAQAIEDVRRGSEHMQNLSNVMADINEASRKINKITKLIDDIAFQTNILALNAAVEAARAGEAGKGFGVVAEEVRSLAGKSSEAAKTTAELIKQSLNMVMRGVMLTEDVGNALIEIEDKSSSVNEILGSINSSASTQAASISQISRGLNEVSVNITTNAATAEESSAASEELSKQASLLYNEVGKFRLE
jgi:methyl-accepting chemotaxis protein